MRVIRHAFLFGGNLHLLTLRSLLSRRVNNFVSAKRAGHSEVPQPVHHLHTIHHKIGFDPCNIISSGSKALTERNNGQSVLPRKEGNGEGQSKEPLGGSTFRSGNTPPLNQGDQERKIALSRTERTNNTTDAHTICSTIQTKLDRSKKSRFPKQDPDQD